jgi:ADP-L-glycero-D-manno-heptose 6-epimerase
METFSGLSPDRAIVVTGAAGFIGSYLCGFLNRAGFSRLILVDDFSHPAKAPNLSGKAFLQQIERTHFETWLRGTDLDIQAIFHLGARTDTTEMDYEVHRVLNLEYSKMVWRLCAERGCALLYASSAATYGAGEHGYDDNHAVVQNLRPLNPYGQSKQDFDEWALAQPSYPPFWAGVKFFNVYGPNEYHKGRMASVVFHAIQQIRETSSMKLFRSHRPDFADGAQSRDFIHVDDVVRICFYLLNSQPASGLYNVGSGVARSFNDLAAAVFSALGVPANIAYIDTPADIRDTYQYFTQARMDKLRAVGYDAPIRSLETGITNYVQAYLQGGLYF